VVLARLPTPVTRLPAFRSPLVDPTTLTTTVSDCVSDCVSGGVTLHLKRDDLSSFDLSGNKVRKLEFLLGQALLLGCDTVVTIGGLQSNHCRATAVAARQLGLTPVLLLRTELSAEQIDLEGNLLLSRMAGARIYTVKPEDYYEKVGTCRCSE
jgi:D-cysteine desulfhydrase